MPELWSEAERASLLTPDHGREFGLINWVASLKSRLQPAIREWCMQQSAGFCCGGTCVLWLMAADSNNRNIHTKYHMQPVDNTHSNTCVHRKKTPQIWKSGDKETHTLKRRKKNTQVATNESWWCEGSDVRVTHHRRGRQRYVAYGGLELINRWSCYHTISQQRLDLDFELFSVVFLFIWFIGGEERGLFGDR